MVANALDQAGLEYLTDFEGKSPANLDFFIPALDLYIEIKGGHSDRIAGQMARHKNVIAVQGKGSVKFMVSLIQLMAYE